MSSLNLRRIARPETLRSISVEHLVGLLRKEAETFIASKVDLDAEADAFDYDTLGALLADPPEDFPPALADALHHIQEMDDPQAMEDLLKETGDLPEAGADLSPADVACRIWLEDSDLLIKVHARRLLFKTKRYVASRGAPAKMPDLDETRLTLLTTFLNGWFSAKKKGTDCVRITTSRRGGTVWLMIRHGLAVDRRAIIKGGKSASSVERPEKYDVVSYVEERGELSVHAGTKGEQELYRTAIGTHLFGSADYFNDREKFTFAPFVGESPRDALYCEDIPELEEVFLKEVQFRYGDRDVIERAPKDLFKSWGAKARELGDALRKVTLLVKFKGEKKPRTVKIELPCTASFTRDDDEVVVNHWLKERGFIIEPKGDHAEGA